MLFLAFPLPSMAIGPIISYVQISTGAVQPGGFNTSTGTVSSSFSLPYVGGTQCIHSINGIVSGSGSDCGSGGGGGVGGAFASWYLVDASAGKWQVAVDLDGHLTTSLVSSIPPGALAPHTLVTQDKNFNLWTIGIDTGGHLTTASAGSTAQSITDLLMNDSTSITWLITIDTTGHLVTS